MPRHQEVPAAAESRAAMRVSGRRSVRCAHLKAEHEIQITARKLVRGECAGAVRGERVNDRLVDGRPARDGGGGRRPKHEGRRRRSRRRASRKGMWRRPSHQKSTRLPKASTTSCVNSLKRATTALFLHLETTGAPHAEEGGAERGRRSSMLQHRLTAARNSKKTQKSQVPAGLGSNVSTVLKHLCWL